MKEFFKKFSVYNYVYLACAYVIIIVGFVLSEEKNVLSLSASIVGVTAFLFTAKGLVIAPICNAVYYTLYAILSITQKFYGEAIVNGLISLPLAIFTIITWLRNKDKNNNTSNVQINSISKKEYFCLIPAIAILFIVFYFLLRVLNTNELVISTISTVCCIIACYLMMRRSAFYSLMYIIADVVVIVLWSMTISSEGLSYIPTLLATSCFFVNDIYGFVSWQIRKRKQDE